MLDAIAILSTYFAAQSRRVWFVLMTVHIIKHRCQLCGVPLHRLHSRRVQQPTGYNRCFVRDWHSQSSTARHAVWLSDLKFTCVLSIVLFLIYL